MEYKPENEYVVTFREGGIMRETIEWAINPCAAFAQVALRFALAYNIIIVFEAVRQRQTGSSVWYKVEPPNDMDLRNITKHNDAPIKMYNAQNDGPLPE